MLANLSLLSCCSGFEGSGFGLFGLISGFGFFGSNFWSSCFSAAERAVEPSEKLRKTFTLQLQIHISFKVHNYKFTISYLFQSSQLTSDKLNMSLQVRINRSTWRCNLHYFKLISNSPVYFLTFKVSPDRNFSINFCLTVNITGRLWVSKKLFGMGQV